MVGTSAAARVVYEAADGRRRGPASSSTGSTSAASAKAARSRTAATCTRGSLATLRDVDTPAIAERPAAAHGLTLPAVPRRRAVARLGPEPARARSTGLTFATTPLDIAQAALEGVCYRLADVLDAIGGVESVVATGARCSRTPPGCRCSPTCSGGRVEVSARRRGLRARRRARRARAARAAVPAGADRARRRAAARPARDPSASRRKNNGS